jgi:four helix bundle protein
MDRRRQMKANRYQDLVAWQKAIVFVQRIYAVTASLPEEEIFGLKSQMRRCAVSIPSNIAEGQGRATRGEFQQFLGHARGSLYELETQIVIAIDLDYVSADEGQILLAEAGQLGRILNALKASLRPTSKDMASPQLTTNN